MPHIYLKKPSAEYARTLNVSEAAHCIRSLYKLLRNYRERDVFRTLSNIFQIERFAKRIMPECRCCAIRNFSGKRGRGWGVKLKHFHKHISSKTQEKEATQENILEFFLPDIRKTTF